MILDTNAVSALADDQEVVLDAMGDVRTPSVPVPVIGEYELDIAMSRHRARYEAWLAAGAPARR